MSDVEIPAFVNKDAGTADAASEALGKAGGFRVERIAPADLADRVRSAIADGARRILVAGGDGSIATAAATMRGTTCELAILPGGTLNHLAQDLGIPSDLTEAARVAASGKTRCLDVAEVNGRLFLNTSSVGAYVTYVRTREGLEPKLGYWLASIVAGIRILFRLRSFRVVMEIDGVTHEFITPLVFIGVGERELRMPSLGARVPNGRRGLHVIVVKSRSAGRTLALAFAAVARGVQAAARTPAMQSFIVDRVRIQPRAGRVAGRIGLDGEIVSMAPPLDYQFVPDALTVIVGDDVA